jgi:hypothetical protein
MLEAAIASQFPNVIDNIKMLEQNAGTSRVGSAVHSIDVSINLGPMQLILIWCRLWSRGLVK